MIVYTYRNAKEVRYKEFTIKDGKAYSRVNKCIDGVISFNPVVLQSSRYDHLTCSTNYIKRRL